MNVLYLHCHDMGRYNSIYGYAIDTPNLQSVAQDATTFTQAFCVCPTCSPSRGAMLTGRYPHNNGLMGLVHRGFAISRPSIWTP
jgi:arylsulfatase A-like enzyme